MLVRFFSVICSPFLGSGRLCDKIRTALSQLMELESSYTAWKEIRIVSGQKKRKSACGSPRSRAYLQGRHHACPTVGFVSQAAFMLYRISLPFWALRFWVEDFKYMLGENRPLRRISVSARSSQTRGHICSSSQATGKGCSLLHPWRGLGKPVESTAFEVVFHTADRTSAEPK